MEAMRRESARVGGVLVLGEVGAEQDRQIGGRRPRQVTAKTRPLGLTYSLTAIPDAIVICSTV